MIFIVIIVTNDTPRRESLRFLLEWVSVVSVCGGFGGVRGAPLYASVSDRYEHKI